jgi:hypothetical protein
MVSKTNAEYIFNLPWKDVSSESKNASINLTSGVSNLFKSFEKMEMGKIADANAQLEKAIKSLNTAKQIYVDIEGKIKKGIVNIMAVPNYQRALLNREFRLFNYPIPKSTHDTAKLAREVIEAYVKRVKDLGFYTNDAMKNRNNIRIMVDDLHRLMLMGINISDLAASNP